MGKMIADAAVVNSKIADAAEVNLKIADAAVVNSKMIADAAVVNSKIADVVVVNSKMIADAAEVNSKIADAAEENRCSQKCYINRRWYTGNNVWCACSLSGRCAATVQCAARNVLLPDEDHSWSVH